MHLVDLHLIVGQLHRHRYFVLLRQFVDDVTLGTTQQKRRDETPQLTLPLLVVIALDGFNKLMTKLLGTAQQSGVDELEEVPQF